MSMCLVIDQFEHCIHCVLYTQISMYNECEWFDLVQHNSIILSVGTSITVRNFQCSFITILQNNDTDTSMFGESVWLVQFQYNSAILLLCTNIKVRNFCGVECILKPYMYDLYSVPHPILQTVIHMECSLGMTEFWLMVQVCLWMLLYVHVQCK